MAVLRRYRQHAVIVCFVLFFILLVWRLTISDRSDQNSVSTAADKVPGRRLSASNSHHNSSINKAVNVIIYLANSERLELFGQSLAKLFDNFNRRYRYPIVIFYEEPMNVSLAIMKLATAAKLADNEKSLLKFAPVKFQMPEGFFPAHGEGLDKLSFVPNRYNSFPSYNHMINFWFQQVFNEPIMQNVTYYWRLDTDSFIESPIEYDIFGFAEKINLVYGYRSQRTDPPFVTLGLWDFVEGFLSRHKLTPISRQFPSIPTIGSQRKSAWVPMYYNNFELVHVPTFQKHSGIQLFVKEVLQSENIYLRRWGDAPLRYLSVNMFFAKPKHIRQFRDIDYTHDVRFRPTCYSPNQRRSIITTLQHTFWSIFQQ